MRELGYGHVIQISHTFKGNFVDENYFPEASKNSRIYEPAVTDAKSRLPNGSIISGRVAMLAEKTLRQSVADSDNFIVSAWLRKDLLTRHMAVQADTDSAES
jgi:hypothetical protein